MSLNKTSAVIWIYFIRKKNYLKKILKCFWLAACQWNINTVYVTALNNKWQVLLHSSKGDLDNGMVHNRYIHHFKPLPFGCHF